MTAVTAAHATNATDIKQQWTQLRDLAARCARVVRESFALKTEGVVSS